MLIYTNKVSTRKNSRLPNLGEPIKNPFNGFLYVKTHSQVPTWSPYH